MAKPSQQELVFEIPASARRVGDAASIAGAKAGPTASVEAGATAGAEAGPTVATVTEIVRRASRHVEGTFSEVWVEGEVSNLRRPASGHAYFTLKDAGAQLAVVLFRSSARRTQDRLENGQTYRVFGRLTIYAAQGRFQLVAERVEATGIGRILAAVEALKRKLAAEGLFDDAHKKPLPVLPRRIAVVTSRTGAALRDILRILDDRWPVSVVLCPASVQGHEAPREIVAALERAEALGVDLIIVGRGGGSLEDLQAFNDEEVARTIWRLTTPTISAVGHEIDTLISDLVADRRAATPTAAAEIAVPSRRELVGRFDRLQERLRRAWVLRLAAAQGALDRLRREVVSPERLIERRRQALDDRVMALQVLMAKRLRTRRDRLGVFRTRLGEEHPAARLARGRGRLDALEARAREAVRGAVDRRRGDLGRLAVALDALSPLAVLGRGYGIVQDEAGRVLRDAADAREGGTIAVRLQRGRLRARVEAIEEVGVVGVADAVGVADVAGGDA